VKPLSCTQHTVKLQICTLRNYVFLDLTHFITWSQPSTCKNNGKLSSLLVFSNLHFFSWRWKGMWFFGILIWTVQRNIVPLAYIQRFYHKMCIYLQIQVHELHVRELGQLTDTDRYSYMFFCAVHCNVIIKYKPTKSTFSKLIF